MKCQQNQCTYMTWIVTCHRLGLNTCSWCQPDCCAQGVWSYYDHSKGQGRCYERIQSHGRNCMGWRKAWRRVHGLPSSQPTGHKLFCCVPTMECLGLTQRQDGFEVPDELTSDMAPSLMKARVPLNLNLFLYCHPPPPPLLPISISINNISISILCSNINNIITYHI